MAKHATSAQRENDLASIVYWMHRADFAEERIVAFNALPWYRRLWVAIRGL